MPMPMRTSREFRPAAAACSRHASLSVNHAALHVERGAAGALRHGRASSSGAFQNAMMASPMYLSMVPRLRRMMSVSGVSSLLMKCVSSAAVRPSEIAVKSRTSQNISDSSRTSPPSSSRDGSATMSSTTAGAR